MFELPDAILVPVAGHLLLMIFLFVMVSLKRMQAVKQTSLQIDDLANKHNEPEASRRWVNNLNNQFELPPLFYALIALLYATDQVTAFMVTCAWIFLIGRILHTWVQASGDNVSLRGQVFMINFLALIAMWVMFLAIQWGF